MKLFEFLQTCSRRSILVLGMALIVLIGGADYWTGPELSVSIFYLIPIALVTWFGNRRAGILASILSAAFWLLADLSGGRDYSAAAIPYWNAGVRFGFFLIVNLTLSSLRAALFRQEELAHFIVHDLRTPLSGVLTGLQLLQEATEEPLETEEEQNLIVEMGIASCNRMLTLVNSILDLARLEGGKMELNRQETGVREIFTTSMQQVAALAARTDVQVTSQVAAGAEVALADAEMTVRVLVNLLSNALKYSPLDSTVALSAAPHAGNWIAIRVSDQGPGIPPEYFDKVFDKFMQIEARKAGIGVGSGLGLSFCRLAVEAQGGRIWLESEAGKGTTFIFTLPRSAPGT